MSEKSHKHRTGNAVLAAGALSLSALIPVATDGPRHVGKHPIDLSEQGVDVSAYAKGMQDTLNEGKLMTGVTILLHNEFDVNPDAQQELGIDKIYTPINMGGGHYAYANVNQETGKVDLHVVDAEDGTLIQPDMTGKFALFVGDIQVQTPFGGEGHVLAIDDPLQMFVGQSVPHIEN
jgi:hypothetical protein